MISTTTRTPLETLVRPTLAKLLDQQPEHNVEKAGHHASEERQVHRNHLVAVDEKERQSFSHSSNGRISGMRFSIQNRIEEDEVWEEQQRKEQERKAFVYKMKKKKQEEEIDGGKLFLESSNDINTLSYSALTGTNPKEEALGRPATPETPKTTKKKGSRGSKKFKLNVHDKDEMQFLRNAIKDEEKTDGRSTTTKRSTSLIPNKYNIDYDQTLEDQYEIIQKVE